MPILPQTSPFLPQAAPDTTGVDSTLVDTLTLADRLRTDSTLSRLSNPSDLLGVFTELQNDFLDVAVWRGLIGVLLHMVVIIILAWITIRLVDKMTRRWKNHVEELPTLHPRRQRAYTISNLISSTARYVIWPIVAIMILSEFNIDVGALIATAGIAGLAFGFGAQTLVKDVISGIFLLFDDTIHVGDLVIIGTEVGNVEYIGVRLIRVRKFDGTLLMVPAGELRMFGNRSIGYARVVVDVGLSYEQDVDAILPVMKQVADVWAEEHREILMEDEPQVQAVTSFGESSVNVRIIVQTLPGEQFQAERDLRLMLKRAFDEAGIEIPFPRRTVYMREEKSPPPRDISLADPEHPDQRKGKEAR